MVLFFNLGKEIKAITGLTYSENVSNKLIEEKNSMFIFQKQERSLQLMVVQNPLKVEYSESILVNVAF